MNVLVMQIPYDNYTAYDDHHTNRSYFPLHWEEMRMIFQNLPFYAKRDTYDRIKSVVWAIYDLLDDLVMP